MLKVLEEMPPYPEKESSLLAKLKKTKPQIDELEHNSGEKKHRPMAVMSGNNTVLNTSLIIDVSLLLAISDNLWIVDRRTTRFW